jgi:hypothetical protein
MRHCRREWVWDLVEYLGVFLNGSLSPTWMLTLRLERTCDVEERY